MDNNFKIGDKVKFLDQVGVAIVTQTISPTQVEIQTKEGFEEIHDVKNIIKIDVETDRASAYKNIPFLNESKTQAPKTKKLNKVNGPHWEVDLHIETILDRYNHLTNYEIVQLQIKKCKNTVERAIQRKVYKLVIIHGKGSGVLREEVHQLLKNYSVEIRDFRFQDFGGGATEVFFFK